MYHQLLLIPNRKLLRLKVTDDILKTIADRLDFSPFRQLPGTNSLDGRFMIFMKSKWNWSCRSVSPTYQTVLKAHLCYGAP